MMTSGPSLAPFRNCWSVSVIVLIGCTSTRAVCAALVDAKEVCDSAENATNAVNLASRRLRCMTGSPLEWMVCSGSEKGSKECLADSIRSTHHNWLNLDTCNAPRKLNLINNEVCE